MTCGYTVFIPQSYLMLFPKRINRLTTGCTAHIFFLMKLNLERFKSPWILQIEVCQCVLEVNRFEFLYIVYLKGVKKELLGRGY